MKRVKNISENPQPIEGYSKGTFCKFSINPGRTAKVKDGYLGYLLSNYRKHFEEVLEPKKRHEKDWIKIIGGAIIGSLVTLLTQFLLG